MDTNKLFEMADELKAAKAEKKDLMAVGSCKYENYPTINQRAVIRNGYLYVIAYDKTGLLFIDMYR